MDESSKLLSGIQVELRLGNQPISYARTDMSGIFSFLTEYRLSKKYGLKIEYMGYDTLITPRRVPLNGNELSFGKIKISLPDYHKYALEQKPELFLPKDEFENSKMYQSRKNEAEKYIAIIREEYQNIKSGNKEKEKRDKLIQIKNSVEDITLSLISIGDYDADSETFSNIILKPLRKSTSETGQRRYGTIFNEYGNVIDISFFRVTRRSNIYSAYQDNEVIGEAMPGEIYDIITTKGNYITINMSDEGKKTINLKNIKVPLSEARSLKKHFKIATVIGKQILDSTLTGFEYYDLSLKHPKTGSIYFLDKKGKDGQSKKPQIKLSPPRLSMRVAFIEDNGNGFLDAKESGEFKIELINNGEGPAKNVEISIKEESPNRYLRYISNTFVGDITPNQTITKRIKVSARKKVEKKVNTFTLNADELNGFSPDPTKVTFETFPFIPPDLQLVDFGIETADGDNRIKPGVVTDLQVRVQNQGKGEAKDISFSFNPPENLFLSQESKVDYEFSSLQQGEFKDLNFQFFVNKKAKSSMELIIDYSEESTDGQFEIELDIKKPQQSINELVIKGRELNNTTINNVATISVDVEKDIPKTKRKSKHDLAIVFGIEFYKDVPGVTFARRDALWMKEYFHRTLNIPEERIYVKTDADVGQAEFHKVFAKGGWLDKRIKKNKSNVFFFFAGHGAPNIDDNRGYLIPYDGDPNYASQTGYAIDQLYEELNRISSKSTTVFLDACFSGVNRNNEMLLANARPVFLEVDNSFTDKVNVYSAAGSKQISSSWPEKKHGLFSYFLMKGIRGDADANGDKKLTYGELGRYLEDNVSSTAGLLDREQTPTLSTQNENNIFIAY